MPQWLHRPNRPLPQWLHRPNRPLRTPHRESHAPTRRGAGRGGTGAEAASGGRARLPRRERHQRRDQGARRRPGAPPRRRAAAPPRRRAAAPPPCVYVCVCVSVCLCVCVSVCVRGGRVGAVRARVSRTVLEWHCVLASAPDGSSSASLLSAPRAPRPPALRRAAPGPTAPRTGAGEGDWDPGGGQRGAGGGVGAHQPAPRRARRSGGARALRRRARRGAARRAPRRPGSAPPLEPFTPRPWSHFRPAPPRPAARGRRVLVSFPAGGWRRARRARRRFCRRGGASRGPARRVSRAARAAAALTGRGRGAGQAREVQLLLEDAIEANDFEVGLPWLRPPPSETISSVSWPPTGARGLSLFAGLEHPLTETPPPLPPLPRPPRPPACRARAPATHGA